MIKGKGTVYTMKVPESKEDVISECSFCDSFAGIQGGICKCSLHPKGIPEDKLRKSYPGLPEYSMDYCKYQCPVKVLNLKANRGQHGK